MIVLVYLLWREAGVSTGAEQNGRSPNFVPLWLYDEVDFEQDSSFPFWHRILLSDGKVISNAVSNLSFEVNIADRICDFEETHQLVLN